MTRIIINGCCGKMGQAIYRTIEAHPDEYQAVAGFDLHAAGSLPFPVFTEPSEFLGEADAIIDFSHPSALSAVLAYATEKGIPAVIATTGLSEAQVQEIAAASQKISVFYSANMSLGVNLLVSLVKQAATLLYGNFDIEIIEKHHNQKLDAPSGTALMIADAISASLPEETEYVYDRHAVRQKRSKNEIGIHAIRGGTIVGEHEVLFAGTDEVLSVTHAATSKEVFAVGAVRAAQFLHNKKSGLYNMDDLIQSIS